MGSKVKAPPPPDYSGLVAASERAAEMSFQLGQEQLAWAKEQYASDSDIIKRVVDDALVRAETNDESASKDRARYEEIFQPLEDKMAQEALSYGSDERQKFEMERAQATVAQNFEAQRRASLQQLESFGVDPTTARYGALDTGSRVAQAAASAGAGNQARAQTEAIGRALQSEAVNVGRGYPGQVAGTYATALQSGNQAANAQLSGTASGATTMGTGTQWFGGGNQSIGTAGNLLNAGYGNQLAAADFNARQSSGLGGVAGALLGAAGNAGGFGSLFAFEDGGAVPQPAPSALPVTQGGNVPMAASPTRGAAIDDVSAKLTAGEFVIPKEAVSWYGEKHFQQLIAKSQKERQQAPARPSYAIAPPQQPTFAS